MTRLTALLLALALLAGCGAGREEPQPTPEESPEPTPEPLDPAVAEALSVAWFDLLYLMEGYCGDTLWALDYAGGFLKEKSRDSLAMAHAAAGAGFDSVSARALPESELPEGLPETLAGAPAVEICRRMAQGGWSGERALFMDTFLDLSAALRAAVFDDEGLTEFSRWADRERGLINAELNYWALLTEDLLLRLDDTLYQARLRAALWDGCPRIAALLRSNPPAALDAAIADAAVQLGALRSAREPVAGGGGESVVIAGLDALLPVPGWETPYAVQCRWYWEAEDGTITVATAGEELSGPPTGCRITWPGVTSGALHGYVEYLSGLGVVPLTEPSEDGGAYSVCYKRGGAVALFSRRSDNIIADMPDGPVWLVPERYPGSTGRGIDFSPEG